jgi:hypothetical protein
MLQKTEGQFFSKPDLKKNWPTNTKVLIMEEERMEGQPKKKESSLWGGLPDGEKAAINTLCEIMKRAVRSGHLDDASVDDCIECFIVGSADPGVKHDLAKRALELGLVATAISDFRSSVLQACGLSTAPTCPPGGPSTSAPAAPVGPTAQQVQVLSWDESFMKSHHRIGEVQTTLRMLSNDLSIHNRPSGQRISRRRRVIQLFDQTLEGLSPHVASLADRIRCHVHGSQKDEELGGSSGEEDDAAACKNDPEAQRRPGDRGFVVHSALERMLQGPGRRRRAMRLCENLAVMRDSLIDEAINLPDLSTEERGRRMDLHRRIGEAVAAEDAPSLYTAIRVIQRHPGLNPEVTRELQVIEMPDSTGN